jgi:hypothetical protein
MHISRPVQRTVGVLCLLLLSLVPGYSQTKLVRSQDASQKFGLFDGAETQHVFPQFLNGPLGGGVYYLSTLTVLPLSTSDNAITCSLRTYGTLVSVSGLGTTDTIDFTLPANGGWYYISTSPTTPASLQAGYATLVCSGMVYANLDFSLYEQGRKTGGATVFSSGEYDQARYISDQTEVGARLAFAIANNTDLSRTYRVQVHNTSGNLVGLTTVTVPARRSLAKFLDEILSGTNGLLTKVTVESTDFSDFASIGLRFVGPTFTTIPPAQ